MLGFLFFFLFVCFFLTQISKFDLAELRHSYMCISVPDFCEEMYTELKFRGRF